MTTRIVVLGGSFNPFGRHHLRVIRELDDRGEFDLILVAPSAAHPLKRDLVPFEHRVAMVLLGISEGLLGSPETRFRSELRVTDLEDELARRDGGFVYTWNLLREVQQRYSMDGVLPEVKFAIGPDIRAELPRWKYVAEIERDFGFVEVSVDGIRATDIRRMIRTGDDAWVDLVASPSQALYIQQHPSLYQTTPDGEAPQRDL